MGTAICCTLLGLIIVVFGILCIKWKSRIGAIIGLLFGAFVLLGGILMLSEELPKTWKPKTEWYTLSDFKKDYEKAAKLCKIPNTMNSSHIKKLDALYNRVVNMTKTSQLYIKIGKNDAIEELWATIGGNKTNGYFDDDIYAISVVCAVENLKSTKEALDFLQSVLNLPIGEYIQAKSGYYYFHFLQDERGLGYGYYIRKTPPKIDNTIFENSEGIK